MHLHRPNLFSRQLLALSGLTITMLLIARGSFGQTVATPSTLNYSRITQSFDRQPPIGGDFQIKGILTSDVVAVKLESFGFDMTGPDRAHEIELINVLTRSDQSRPLCDVLLEVRNSDARPRGKSSWERPEGAAGTALTQFSLNHPRLYYGRRYVFMFSYYRQMTDNEKKEIAKRFVESVNKVLVEKAQLDETMSREDWTAELIRLQPEIKAALGGAVCGEDLLNRRTLEPVDLASVFNPLLAYQSQSIKDHLVLHQGIQSLERLRPELEKQAQRMKVSFDELSAAVTEKKWDKVSHILLEFGKVFNTSGARFTGVAELNNLLTNFITHATLVKSDITKQGDFSTNQAQIDAASAKLQGMYTDALGNISAKDWPAAHLAIANLKAILLDQSEQYKTNDAIAEAIGEIRYASASTAGIPLDQVIESAAAVLPFSTHDEILTATTAQPYFESMDKEQQFLISLDGGLNYVSQFREMVPTVGINFKLNRIDFDDPWNRRTEYSIVLGLGMTKPDDLDPDYKGIFDRTGDKSLLVGLGLRSPRITRLLRLQAGFAFYRQADGNPVVRDYSTRASPYIGISLNWNTLDFAAGLFRNRSNFNIGF